MAKTVLTVDDDDHICRIIQYNLQRVGYNVETAHDGFQAIDRIAAHCPDLVICDLVMPGMNGFEVVSRLRAHPETESIPVIMLTANASEAHTRHGLVSGADIYLTEPFLPAELVRFVNRFLETGDPSGDGVVREELTSGGAEVQG